MSTRGDTNKRKMSNFIPKDLFPIVDNEYNLEWAKKTYAYSHLFSECRNTLDPEDEDVINWRNKALQVRLELSNIGKVTGRQRMLEVAKVQFNMKIKGTDISPKCIDDILKIICDKEWYTNNKRDRINQIYMLVYGITRQGFNQWLLDLERSWLEERNLTYVSLSGQPTSTRCSRGCVFSLLKKVFNNSTIKLFKEAMWVHHQEFLCVRLKSKMMDGCPIDVKQLNCHFGKIYLCSRKPFVEPNTHNIFTSNDNMQLKNIEEYGKYWVINSVNNGVSKTLLHKQLDRWIESFKRSQTKKTDARRKCFKFYLFYKIYILCFIFFTTQTNNSMLFVLS